MRLLSLDWSKLRITRFCLIVVLINVVSHTLLNGFCSVIVRSWLNRRTTSYIHLSILIFYKPEYSDRPASRLPVAAIALRCLRLWVRTYDLPDLTAMPAISIQPSEISRVGSDISKDKKPQGPSSLTYPEHKKTASEPSAGAQAVVRPVRCQPGSKSPAINTQRAQEFSACRKVLLLACAIGSSTLQFYLDIACTDSRPPDMSLVCIAKAQVSLM
jgi:hypothetical protein